MPSVGLVDELRRGLRRETGLARTTGAHDRDQTIPADETCDGCDVVEPSHEARQLDGEVVAVRVQRVERRKVVRQPRPGHLIDALGAGEIAQTMLAEVEQRDLVAEMVDEEITGGLRDQDLAAVGDRAQPRRSNDRLARIVAVGRGASLPRMDRHSHPQRRRSGPTLRRQRSLCFDRRQHRIRRPREGRHDRVALALRERTHPTMS